MRFERCSRVSLFAFLFVLNTFGQAPHSSNPDLLQKFTVPSLGFEENAGQFNKDVNFICQSAGYDVYLEGRELVIAFHRQGMGQTSLEIVRINFLRARKDVKPYGKDVLPGATHYYVGNNPAKWNTDIRRFDKVQYPEIYPGVDLIFYRQGRQLEFDYDLAAGASSSTLGLAFDGATLRLHKGNLELKTPSGNIAVLKKPELFQIQGGKRHQVSGSYVLRKTGQVAFKVGRYNKHLPLVIDPALVYSTLVGAALDMTPFAIAVDSNGAAYLTGKSTSPGPVPNAFVMKLDPTGSTLIYLTHLGGSNQMSAGSPETPAAGFQIAVDAGSNSYITGITDETDFPVTTGAFSTSHLCANGGQGLGCEEAFASKLDANGKLVYSTFLAKTTALDSAGPMPSSIAVDSNGALYVTGTTFEQPLPVCNGCIPQTVAGLTTTQGAFQTSRNNSSSGFVLKLHPDGSALDYSTYLGGSTGETGGGIAVDSSGVAYVDGGTSSGDFPVTSGAFQTTNSGTNAFFSKLKADGSGLLYSTFLSGPSAQSEATSIAIDSSKAAYLVGITDSSFPARSFGNSDEPAFAAKFDASGGLVYSKPLANHMTFGFDLFVGTPPQSSIAADDTGAAYIAVGSGGFFNSTISVSKLDLSGAPVYTANVGPIASTNSRFGGMAMDTHQNFYLSGVAGSLEDNAGSAAVIIPDIVTTPGAFQAVPMPVDNTRAGSQEIMFVQKFAQSLGSAVPTPNPRLVTFFTALQEGKKSDPRTITLFNHGDADLTINNISLGGANPSDFAISNNQCGTTVTIGQSCTLLVTFSPTVTQGTRTATVDWSFAGGVASQSTVLSGQAGIPIFQAVPNPLNFGTAVVGKNFSLSFLTITNTGTAPMNLLATPAVVGANSSEFFVCVPLAGHCALPFVWPSSLDPGTKIDVPMAFLPSATGLRTAQFIFQTDAPGSPQMVQLSGTGTDSNVPFTIVPQNNNLTISAGQTATYNLSVATGSNVSGAITVSCSGAPTAASCTANPSSYNAAPTTSQNIQVLVSTTVRTSTFPANRLPSSWWLPGIALGFVLVFLRRFRKPLRLAGAFALSAALLACGGGGGSSGGGGGGGQSGTPSGTYTITVSVSGSGTSASMPLTLVVQ